MGSAAPANFSEPLSAVPQTQAPKMQVEPQPPSTAPAAVAAPPAPLEKLQSAVLQALMDGNQRILVSMLEAGEWSVEGNEV
jgi:hypothetical protein